ncbi:hypothetical protein [Scytonema sp. NUACC26]|uniref:hypothetical protein n=1 Tax=Scytonema sp. NUACC26 TaxID=3140176 RepID=UPI0034DC0D09
MVKCKAAKVYSEFWKNYEPFDLIYGYKSRLVLSRFRVKDGKHFDYCHEISIYDDDSIFVQTIDFYPEFWAVYEEYYWVDYSWGNLSYEEKVDIIELNNCGTAHAFKNAHCFLNWCSKSVLNQLVCNLYDFSYFCEVNEKYEKYSPCSSSLCVHYIEEKLPKLNNRYDFWLRCYAKNEWQQEYYFDVFYPRFPIAGAKITVRIEFPHRPELNFKLRWIDGQRDLFQLIQDEFVEKVTDLRSFTTTQTVNMWKHRKVQEWSELVILNERRR